MYTIHRILWVMAWLLFWKQRQEYDEVLDVAHRPPSLCQELMPSAWGGLKGFVETMCDRLVYLGGGFKDFLFSARNLGKWSNLTSIFQMGWFNHQLVILALYLWNEQQPTVEPVKMLDLHRDFFPKSRCLGDKLSLFQFVSSISKKMSFPVCPALI